MSVSQATALNLLGRLNAKRDKHVPLCYCATCRCKCRSVCSRISRLSPANFNDLEHVQYWNTILINSLIRRILMQLIHTHSSMYDS